jgi:hypothetical protein
MLTGIAAIDTLTPIGCGQSVALIGGPTSRWNMPLHVARFAARSQRTTKVVYANLGSSDFPGDVVIPSLTAAGATLLQPGTGASKSHSLLCAMGALAIGKACAAKGGDALVVVDDLGPIRDVWDASSRLVTAHYGRDGHGAAGPSELRSFYAALTERAASFSDSGGTVTAVLGVPCSFSRAARDQIVALHASEDAVEYKPEDFPEEEAATAKRVGLLRSRGITVTASVLKKLQLQPPGRAIAEARAAEHVETIKSLSDGHIVIEPKLEVRLFFTIAQGLPQTCTDRRVPILRLRLRLRLRLHLRVACARARLNRHEQATAGLDSMCRPC